MRLIPRRARGTLTCARPLCGTIRLQRVTDDPHSVRSRRRRRFLRWGAKSVFKGSRNLRLWSALVVVCLVAALCEDGIQKGNYATSGHSFGLSGESTSGYVSIQPINADGSYVTEAPSHLYFLLLHPGFDFDNFVADGRYLAYSTEFGLRWTDPLGQVSALDLIWDRRTSRLTLGGQPFDLTAGNVFVLYIEPGWQLGSDT